MITTTTMMNLKKNVKNLALAGVLGVLSAGQSAEAVFVFDVVDSDTFTVTAQGSSLTEASPTPNGAAWGIVTGGPITGAVTPSNGATGAGVTSGVYVSAGQITGIHLNGFLSSITIPDGGVYTVSGVTGVDLQTLTLPGAPLTENTAIITIPSGDGQLTFVPEPSSSALLALGSCALLLRRRKRA